MKELLAYKSQFFSLSKETEEAVKQLYKIEHYKKNDFILKEGQICTKVSFIQTGLVRRFYHLDGIEATRWIYSENQFIASLPSFFKQIPSRESLQACEDCTLFSLSFNNEQKLLEYPDYEKFHRIMLREYIAGLSEFHYHFKLMSPEEKYHYLQNYFPEILKRAKLGHVASLLGIAQETLSRIRAKR